VQELERGYVVLEFGPLGRANPFLPPLRAHLREERMKGVEIFPGRRGEGWSMEGLKGEMRTSFLFPLDLY
jgi:hypothetical protein